MSTYKNSTAAKTTVTRNTSELYDKVDGNLFETIVLLTKRANQISREMKGRNENTVKNRYNCLIKKLMK